MTPQGFSPEPMNQSAKTWNLGIQHRVLLASTGKVLAAVFPKSIEGTDGHRVVALLQEATQPFALRAAVLCIFRIVDVDLQFSREELREARIGKIQDEAASSNKIHEVVDESQIDGTDRTNGVSSRKSRPNIRCRACGTYNAAS